MGKGRENSPFDPTEKEELCANPVFPGILKVRTGSQAGPAPWPWAFLIVSLLWNVGVSCWGNYWRSKWPVSSNPSYLPPRLFSNTPWTPSQQFFGSLLADTNHSNPAKEICLPRCPLPHACLTPSLWASLSGEMILRRKVFFKRGGRKKVRERERVRKHLEKAFYILDAI